LKAQLDSAAQSRQVIAAIHHVPFEALLPPMHSAQWDFARAYLGASRLGELLRQSPNVTRLFCGHSHFPAEAQIASIQAVNIGSGYRHKRFKTIDLDPDDFLR